MKKETLSNLNVASMVNLLEMAYDYGHNKSAWEALKDAIAEEKLNISDNRWFEIAGAYVLGMLSVIWKFKFYVDEKCNIVITNRGKEARLYFAMTNINYLGNMQYKKVLWRPMMSAENFIQQMDIARLANNYQSVCRTKEFVITMQRVEAVLKDTVRMYLNRKARRERKNRA